MSVITKEKITRKPFADKKNYPYGFARSGDFSINESKLLQGYGSLFAALVDGKITPGNDEEQAYLESALGHREPATSQEKAWLKYQARINRPKTASIYGSKRPSAEEVDDDEDISDNSDIDISLDD
ncbi:DUF413 domain-containing protein [Alteromonas mediterranea]|nr:DUF413 domain-containing protein [Alteromonas mediterranea]AFV84035.1 hypothetical protein amad1_02525 [Alteromonas mediterranea DE1]AGP96050.1 hypothetical protein I635_02525 [Alteromonas mediterranea UM7]AGQ00384.1 hypothetical protein I636_02540 [Alteromonas mediterranea UM4b]AMJ77250.1 hypothetical protein AV942_02460 [Alteromonas mediterranea]AMJ81392.1 hypothetical protein AV941_02450 [Alteromonas mediterranea]